MKNIKFYNSYKNSNIEWLGKIPTHWKVLKAKRLFNERSEKGHPNEPLLAATQSKGVIPKTMYGKTTVTASKNFETLKLVRKGDFVISLRSFQGGIEYAHYQGIISPAYTIFKPNEMVIESYYRYLLKSKHFISGLTLLVTGIREGQNIDTVKFKDSYLPLPPIEEQKAIAKFIDYKLSKIDRFIQKKKQLIKLLNEQKLNVIYKAVTKGIDENVKLKPSGVLWLADIPEHWKIDKIKYLLTKPIAGQWGTDPKNDTNDIICIRVADFNDFDTKTQDLTIRNIEAKDEQILKYGDLLIEKSGGGEKTPVGRVVTFNKDFKAVTSNFVSKVSVIKSKVLPDYMLYVFKAINCVKWNVLSIKQTTGIQNLDSYSYFDNLIYLPDIKEQQEIINHIHLENITTDNVIQTIEKEIALVQEFRTSLIAEAVTGKIDINNCQVPDIVQNDYNEVDEELDMVAEDGEEMEIE